MAKYRTKMFFKLSDSNNNHLYLPTYKVIEKYKVFVKYFNHFIKITFELSYMKNNYLVVLF